MPNVSLTSCATSVSQNASLGVILTFAPASAALAMFFGSTIRFMGASCGYRYGRPVLQQACAFDVQIAVHQRDRKLLGLDVEALCPAAREPAERELAVAQVVRRGGVGKRAIEAVDARLERPRQDRLAERREEHEVALAQQRERGREGVLVLVAQVRDDDDQRALPEPRHE